MREATGRRLAKARARGEASRRRAVEEARSTRRASRPTREAAAAKVARATGAGKPTLRRRSVGSTRPCEGTGTSARRRWWLCAGRTWRVACTTSRTFHFHRSGGGCCVLRGWWWRRRRLLHGVRRLPELVHAVGGHLPLQRRWLCRCGRRGLLSRLRILSLAPRRLRSSCLRLASHLRRLLGGFLRGKVALLHEEGVHLAADGGGGHQRVQLHAVVLAQRAPHARRRQEARPDARVARHFAAARCHHSFL